MIIAVALSGLLAASSKTPQDIFSKTTTQAEIELGRTVYEQALRNQLISTNEAEQRRVQRVLDQLQGSMKDRPYPFQAVIVADNTVNAACLPGGYMFVHQGLLVKMPRDEQLALIMGHEMGHAVKRHWAKKHRRMQSDAIGDVIGSILLGNSYWAPDRTLQYLAFSREHEYESDSFGTELYLRAGFPADQVASGMQALLEANDQNRKPPEYLSSHPDTAKRVERIKLISKEMIAGGLKVMDPGQPIEASVKAIYGDLPLVAAEGNAYLPMIPGTTWVYSVTSGSGEATYSIKVVGCATVFASKVARFETVVGEKTVTYQISADQKSIYRRNRPEKEGSPWLLDFLAPEVGGSEVSGNTQYKFIATETVSTPAGVFENCMKLEIRDRQGRVITSWYAPDIGLVKRINEASKVVETLTSFRKG